MENFFFGEPLNDVVDIENLSTENFRFAIDSNRRDLAEVLHNAGYVFIDRTVKATIPLKSMTDFQKFCRLKLEDSPLNERICEIAEKSFLQDVRFFSSFPPRFDKKLLDDYLSEMKTCCVCRVKNEIAGFIEVVTQSNEGGGY